MRRCFLLLCLFSIVVMNGYSRQAASNPAADSLQKQLQQATTDSAKAMAYYALAASFVSDSAKAAQYLRQGYQYSRQTPFLLALHLYYQGYLLAKLQPEKAKTFYLQADTLLRQWSTPEAFRYRARTWYDYGAIMQRQDDSKAFTDILIHQAIPLAKQSGDHTVTGKDYLALALVFKNGGEYEKAAAYIFDAIQEFKQPGVAATELITAYHTLAENYALSGQSAKASLILDTAQTLLKAYPDSFYYLDFYAAAGLNYTVEGKFKAALASLDKGVALARQLGLRYEEQRLVLQQFYAWYNDKNFDKAKSVLQYLLQQPEMMQLATNRLQLYYGMAATYEGLEQMTQAYEWMKKYSELSDSLSRSQLKNDVHAMEIKYRNAEKQQEINALKAKNLQESLSVSNSRLMNWLMGGTILFLLVVLVLAQIIYRHKKKLQAQKELSYQQQLWAVEQQQLLQFSQGVLEGEEKERRRLARDLHDGLGGMLAGAKINLSAQLENTLSQGQHIELEKITQQLDHSVTELRRIAHNMMPVNLLKFGLKTALKDLCESLINDTTHIDFQTLNMETPLREEVQLHIYRIVQELLSNAIRHGQATHIILQCSQDDNRFFITQEDNGKGFDQQAAHQQKGIGLSNIRNRVGFLRGKIDIESIVNEGTTINIELYVD
ncbi:tetratricopeptide repeat-containing sensor histidine kinase [Chitinophaga nivalis]|uniref:histidine kinase n=1 Tax=Chitinophaga nivalis TaxID=2991709 RepID=A0ABT3IKJ0_9BACT|nr:sensor histidine kinase [Chitinophaga nivalis]MCW3465837.1 sensor histidine kinase [Chitinophaga nivalis]MCW3484472.1 sensor histidine kinase [Chitinophaga nivalis]